MKFVFLVFVLVNNVYAQSYGKLQSNRGPDHGSARNFGVFEWKGIPSVGSELTVSGQTYFYIRNSSEEFKLSRKNGDNFQDIVPRLKSKFSSTGMDEYSRLLHVYEDSEIINIYCWGVQGYNFIFYQKRENQEPRLIRFGSIKNINHTYFAFDQSIESIEFSGATQMKIATKPAVEDGTKGYYNFKRPGVYEFRPDGIYLDGVFDPSVQDYEPQDVVDENVGKDPQHYLKKQALHAARVASWTKEQMDAQALITAAQPPQPTRKPTPPESIPAVNPTPTATAPVIAQESPPSAEPALTKNLTPWLAGLVAVLVMLLGYLGLRYIRKKARP
jgi:hypothetical protein